MQETLVYVVCVLYDPWETIKKCMFDDIVIPIAIAGGSAYSRRRTNWYKGSGCTKPNWVAPLITRIPKIGSMIYRTTNIPMIVQNEVSAPFKPVSIFIQEIKKLFKICHCQRGVETKWYGYARNYCL